MASCALDDLVTTADALLASPSRETFEAFCEAADRSKPLVRNLEKLDRLKLMGVCILLFGVKGEPWR